MLKNAAKYIRPAINLIVSLTTYSVTKAVIKSNVAEPETRLQKASLATGSFVLGSIVSNYAAEWADQKVTALLEAVPATTEAIKKAAADAQ